MKHFIIKTLEAVSIVIICFLLVMGVSTGYNSNGEIGAIVGLIAALLASVFFFGIVFILMEMNESLHAIRQQLTQPDSRP